MQDRYLEAHRKIEKILEEIRQAGYELGYEHGLGVGANPPKQLLEEGLIRRLAHRLLAGVS